jgi:hypothetical protein
VTAATDRNVVQWLPPDHTTLRPRAEVLLAVPARVVALVARGDVDLVAVLADGTALRVAPGNPRFGGSAKGRAASLQ